MKLKKIKPLDNGYLESIGFGWHTDLDGSRYISNELVSITQDEAEAFYEATNELYDMYVAAAEYVINNDLFHELGIPFNLVDTIKASWENDVHWHIYGRFDLAGGVDGKPIKLIEFNADTPTSLFETAIIQWAMLKFNNLDEAAQFNDVYEALVENFKRLVTLQEDTSAFDEYYEGWKILFSSIAGSVEDENTTRLLESAARDAGFECDFAFASEVSFDDENGIFWNEQNWEYWFKLIPWEMIAIDESDLALIIKNIIKNQKAIILNPAYTLLFQSKGIMKILWDLYPNHPLLLESSFEPLKGKKQVKKPFLAREGANVSIINSDGSIEIQNDGEYASGKFLYQEFADFAKDENGDSYQAGMFFAFEGCALGFRKGKDIIDNYSKFVGHIIE
ncbi:glutathionylspermidine synthase [Campylobacter devanensis]|uniref:Glutathionylspermidine amidase / glutathionylspermidine synthetase n=1 Tax=Campylobacter devanensis TaxID=3161138 RepID=A0A1X9SQF4_9BACT|nr:glutathionylspermidine synthase family protein [Campylobacter lanienae]ARQ98477.1 glutathionylspermidine amidase / glutathionylspermidine synthetase [Campylobacter lanienae]SUX01524.1 glutathionylspermidine synthase [Campylobacter lanienae]